MANQSIKDAFQRFWEYVTAKIESQKTVVVTVTEDANGEFTADKTYEELVEAINAGKDCKAHFKPYGVKDNGDFLNLAQDLTGQYPYVEFNATLGSSGVYRTMSIAQGGSVSLYKKNFAVLDTNGNIPMEQLSELAETLDCSVEAGATESGASSSNVQVVKLKAKRIDDLILVSARLAILGGAFSSSGGYLKCTIYGISGLDGWSPVNNVVLVGDEGKLATWFCNSGGSSSYVYMDGSVTKVGTGQMPTSFTFLTVLQKN